MSYVSSFSPQEEEEKKKREEEEKKKEKEKARKTEDHSDMFDAHNFDIKIDLSAPLPCKLTPKGAYHFVQLQYVQRHFQN